MADSTSCDICRIPARCRERFLPLKDAAAAPLKSLGLTLAGISHLCRGYKIRRSDPQFHLVLYCLDGTGNFETSEQEGQFEPGKRYVFPAGHPHSYWAEKQWSTAWVHIRPQGRWRELHVPPVQEVSRVVQEKLVGAMDGLISEVIQSGADSHATGRAFSNILATLLKRDLLTDVHQREQNAQNELHRLWLRVNADLARTWRIRELAGELGVSSATLHRMSILHDNAAPMNVVVELRMARTKELLENTDYSLKTICSLVGYETPFALSRAFKKHTGVSPKYFRQRK